MKPIRFGSRARIVALIAVSLVGVLVFSQREAKADDLEVLTRGPVHEAFAESVSYEPQPGILISEEVPEMIEELPPEQRPDGQNVAWIPGYWAWDDDQSDFLWISGIWRDLPPGRQWMPGYWSDVDGRQYQWTSGYWADEQSSEVAYISTAPPRSIEAGPNIAAPSDNHSWVPGNWMWSDTRYMWRPGSWHPQRENRIWVPSRYVWTRRGYVYVDGYWDYAVPQRGVLFAPVHFHGNAYASRSYTPNIVISLGALVEHLFVRPRSSHYYFGDYYAPSYRDSGYYPSYAWYSGGRGYEPIYAYQRWEHRKDKKWEKEWEKRYDHFRDHSEGRPPRTWASMKKPKGPGGFDQHFASPFSSYVDASEKGRNFKKLDKKQRDEIVLASSGMRAFRDERQKMERVEPSKGKDPKKGSVARVKLDKSSIKWKGGRDSSTGNPASKHAEMPKPGKEKAEKGRVEPDQGSKRGNTKPDEKKPKGNPGSKPMDAPEKKARQNEPTKKEPKAAPPSRQENPSKDQMAPKRDDRAKGKQSKPPSKAQAVPKNREPRESKPPKQAAPPKQEKASKGKAEAPAKRASKPEKSKGSDSGRSQGKGKKK